MKKQLYLLALLLLGLDGKLVRAAEAARTVAERGEELVYDGERGRVFYNTALNKIGAFVMYGRGHGNVDVFKSRDTGKYEEHATVTAYHGLSMDDERFEHREPAPVPKNIADFLKARISEFEAKHKLTSDKK